MDDTTWNPEYPYRMVGNSPVLRLTRREIARASKFGYPVLISGETGVGKELVARNIHLQSARGKKPLVAVNCGGISEGLLESELFGYEPHSFTGAGNHPRKGKIEESHGSTLFLDEVGELGNRGQGALLRVLQDNKVVRVGGNTERAIDFRLICATNVSLEEALKDGRVRRDFYERINVIAFHIPPLRERIEDIPLLASYFMNRYCGEIAQPPKTFQEGALDVMTQYPWLGNIRELENVVRRLIAQLDDTVIQKGDVDSILRSRYELTSARKSAPPEAVLSIDLSTSSLSDTSRTSMPTLDEIALVNRALDLGLGLKDYEELAVRIALERAGGNQSAGARMLGISRDQIRYRMEACGLLPLSRQRREREAPITSIEFGSFIILDRSFSLLYSRASSQKTQGNTVDAIAGYQDVLTELTRLDGAITESTRIFYVAHVKNALGECYLAQSQHDLAFLSFQRSIELYDRLLTAGNNDDTLHLALGHAHLGLARLAETTDADCKAPARQAVRHFSELFDSDALPPESLESFYTALSYAEDLSDQTYNSNLRLQRSVLEKLVTVDPGYTSALESVRARLQ